MKVKLEEIIQEIESQGDTFRSFLNKETGELESISDEEFEAAENDSPLENYPSWQQGTIKKAAEILYDGHWIDLPSQFDIHEYEIMERFCLSTENETVGEMMYNNLQGKGAFRRFKENVRKHNLLEAWYEFYENALKEIAIEWCKSHGIVCEDYQGESSE